MDRPHLYLGHHPEYGYVAVPGAALPEHLKHWLLSRVQFEPVAGSGLYRMRDPHHDGTRRARQAVTSLRAGLQNIRVQADYSLDPDLTPDHPAREWSTGLSARRTRIAEAARARSPQHSGAPSSRGSTAAPGMPPSAAARPDRGRAH